GRVPAAQIAAGTQACPPPALTGRSRSDHLPRLVLARHPAIRRELVDEGGEIMPEPVEQIVASHPGLLRERVERVASERARKGALRDGLVGSGTDPGICNVALAALLELLEQSAETAVEHRAGGGGAENATHGPAEHGAKTSRQPARV